MCIIVFGFSQVQRVVAIHVFNKLFRNWVFHEDLPTLFRLWRAILGLCHGSACFIRCSHDQPTNAGRRLTHQSMNALRNSWCFLLGSSISVAHSWLSNAANRECRKLPTRIQTIIAQVAALGLYKSRTKERETPVVQGLLWVLDVQSVLLLR